MSVKVPEAGVIKSAGTGPTNPKITTSAEALAASVILTFMDGSGLESQGVYEEVRKRTDSVHAGNMEVAERMLMSQALYLQTAATTLFMRAAGTQDIKVLQPLMQLALKAQSNCRVTLETLNEFKNPRSVAFVRQTNVANVAHGPQQVNFEAEPARALKRARGKSEKPFKTNELLEANHGGTHLDTGTTSTAAGGNRELETVGAVHRPQKPAGKVEKLSERQGARPAIEALA